MKRAPCLLLALSLAACTDQPAEPHDVEWFLRDSSTVNLSACIGIRVAVSPRAAAKDWIELPCTATETVVMIDRDESPTRVAVGYQYLMIPLGCESRACWSEQTMAGGDAEIDPAAPRTTIVIEPNINLPF